MKISTKGRYGLRALVDLAVHSSGQQQVSLNSIARRQNISENYLEQVFSTLRKTGIVKSIKGAQGGYLLAHNAKDIKVGDVLRILEGNLSITDLNITSVEENRIKHCVKKHIWDVIDERIKKLVDSITIQDLIHEYKKINGTDSQMFYI